MKGWLKDKINKLIDVMNEIGLDVLCVTETKRIGIVASDLPAGQLDLCSGVFQSNHVSTGVGILLSSSLLSGVKDYGIRIKLEVTRVFIQSRWIMMNGTQFPLPTYLDLAQKYECYE